MYTRQQSTLHTDRDGIYARGFAGRDTHMLHPRIIYRMAAMQCESGQACHRPPPLPATHPDRRLSTDTAIRSSGSGLAWLLTVWKSSPSGQCAVRPLTQRAPCIATTAAYLSIDCVSTYGTYLRQCCAGVCSVCRVRAHLSSDGPTADADADACALRTHTAHMRPLPGETCHPAAPSQLECLPRVPPLSPPALVLSIRRRREAAM